MSVNINSCLPYYMYIVSSKVLHIHSFVQSFVHLFIYSVFQRSNKADIGHVIKITTGTVKISHDNKIQMIIL